MTAQRAAAGWTKVARMALAIVALAGGVNAQAVRTVSTPDSTWALAAPSPEAALDTLVARGYLLARREGTEGDTLRVALGAQAEVRSLRVLGGERVSAPEGWQTRTGVPYDALRLRRDLAGSARRYARLGFTDAEIVPEVVAVDGGQGVVVTVRITEGPARPVAGVELVGSRSRSDAYASRIAGLGGPRSAASLDAERIRQALDATGLFLEVGQPSLARDGDRLVLQVPVVDAPPGAVDVVVGYLPPQAGQAGGVVGRGRVDLRNVFGGGRTATVDLVRTPGLASSLGLDVFDPFLLGTPFGVGVSFAGEAQDSTLSRQRLGADVRYAFDPGFEVVGSLARETVRPGTFGASDLGGRPRVQRSDDLVAGVGIRLQRLDAVRAPRAGVVLAVGVEQGRQSVEAARSGVRRLRVRSRGYVPLTRRAVAVVGLDALVSRPRRDAAGLADVGDLVRTGGAASFRGYDEASLLASSVVRVLAEARVRLDRQTEAVAFLDAGALDRPRLPDADGDRRALLGYGLGIQVGTGIGPVSLSYALNPGLGLARGKVHVGLAVGL